LDLLEWLFFETATDFAAATGFAAGRTMDLAGLLDGLDEATTVFEAIDLEETLPFDFADVLATRNPSHFRWDFWAHPFERPCSHHHGFRAQQV
jgi:hypothetical protein